MMSTQPRVSSGGDAAILARLIRPEDANLTAAAAKAWLAIHFDSQDLAYLHELVTKNQDDALTPAEKADLESYLPRQLAPGPDARQGPPFLEEICLRVLGMDADLVRLVWQRAAGRCEYCHLPQAASGVPFEIEHIIARKHRGRTVAGNTAASGIYCNGYKGPNIAGLDPLTGKLTRLFHPRRHKWDHHFRYEGGILIGRTAIGRTTIEVLRINQPNLVALRETLMEDGEF